MRWLVGFLSVWSSLSWGWGGGGLVLDDSLSSTELFIYSIRLLSTRAREYRTLYVDGL